MTNTKEKIEYGIEVYISLQWKIGIQQKYRVMVLQYVSHVLCWLHIYIYSIYSYIYNTYVVFVSQTSELHPVTLPSFPPTGPQLPPKKYLGQQGRTNWISVQYMGA